MPLKYSISIARIRAFWQCDISSRFSFVTDGVSDRIIGGINWGIYGIWGFNAVGWLLGGSMSWLSRTVFIVVGAAALCLIPGLFAPDPKAAE